MDDKELFFNNKINTQNRDAADVVTQGLLDKNGNIWFTTLTQGVYKYDGTSFTNLTMKDGLCSDKVN